MTHHHRGLSVQGSRTGQLFAAILLTALFTAVWLYGANSASAAIINQPMTGSTAPGWVFGGTPTSASLTGNGTIDPVGDGWLRLTNNSTDQAGYAFYDTPFDVSNGVVIQFDYATWGGTGADGYTIFLFDGSVTPATFQIGASGGSLGFAPKTVAPVSPGLSSGYLGVGIDEFGNFSNPTEGRTGGPGQRAQSVAVRGPASSNYSYIGGTAANIGTLWFNQGTRPVQTGPQYRKVIIQLTPVAAPNYLKVDVFVQFGAGLPYTQVLSGLNVGKLPPATVKIGYAASTGGSTNYHEIRNLVIDPLSTATNLGMTKTASLASIVVGSALTYTVTARNYGPSNVTASNVPIIDNVPAQLTGVTWTCAGTGGATCGAASGSGNTINTTATLPFNGTATYTISGTLTANPPGGVLTNTASLTVPAGITDINSADDSATATVTVVGAGAGVTVSGTVYNDVNLNGVLDGGEVSSNINNIFAKLFRSDGTWLQTVAVTQASGAYSFSSVPAFGTYTIILSDNNAATFTPSFPATAGVTQWVFTQPVNFTLTNVAVGNANVTGQNFGVFRGTRLAGRVFVDNGSGGGASNDGLQNGSEVGLFGVAVGVCNNTAACTGTANTITTTTTDSNGDYVLYIPWGNAFQNGTARIAHNLLTNYLMVNYNAGSTPGSAVSTANGYMTFTFARGTDHTGVLLADVPDNTFATTPQAQSSPAGTTVYYPHTFTPGSGGSLSIAVNGRTQGTWPAVVLYRDAACDGIYNSGTDPVLTTPIATTTGSPVCILAAVSIPAAAAAGTTDVLTIRATFTFTGSARPAASTYDVIDTTTVGPSANLTIVKFASPSPASSGQVITYTVTVTNTGGGTAQNVLMVDDFSPYSQWGMNSYGAGVAFQFTDGTPASGLTLGAPLYSNDRGATWLYTPTSGGGGAPAGYDGNVTSFRLPMTGTMNAGGANFTLRYTVRVK